MNNNRQPTERSLKIYLPDGHLYKLDKEPIGAGKEIWEYTGLPYSMLDYDADRNVGTPTTQINGNGNSNGNGRGYVLRVSPREAESLGYPTGDMDSLYLIVRRPHNIPESIRQSGLGISGKDFFIDRLNLDDPLSDSSEAAFLDKLGEHGIVNATNLHYRPTSIVLAFPLYRKIREYEDMTEFKNNKLRIATEYPWIAERKVRGRCPEINGTLEIIKTDGKTEGYIPAGDSEGIVEVCETGNSIVDNSLNIVVPHVLDVSMPYIAFNKGNYEMFPEFCDELLKRVVYGRDMVKEKYPELFTHSIRPDAYWSEKKANPRIIISPTRAERAEGSLAKV